MKTSVRRRIAAAALLLAAPAVTACAQGFGAQTDQTYQPVNGVTSQLQGLTVAAAAVVAGKDNRGTLSTTIVSQKAVTLTGVTGDGVTATGLPQKVRPNQPLNLSKGGVTLEGTPIVPGGYVKLTFTFDDGTSTELNVPVVTQMGDYTDVPLPTSTPMPAKKSPSAVTTTPAS